MFSYTVEIWRAFPGAYKVWEVRTFRIFGIPLYRRWTQISKG